MSERTQHQIVIDLCKDGRWVCQNEFRAVFVFSPHKRRVEIEGRKNRQEEVKGEYEFFDRKCIHGFRGQKDYRMIANPNYSPPEEKEKSIYETPRKLKSHPIQMEIVDRINNMSPFVSSRGQNKQPTLL